MQQEWSDKIIFNTNRREWWSKLTDGLLAVSVLFLTWTMIMLAIWPIANTAGLPGLLIYAVCLLAFAMLFLQQSLVYQHHEAMRAWFGMTSGALAWSVIVVGSFLGSLMTFTPASFILFLMAALVVFLLWKSALPLGARFFCMTFLLHWAGYLTMNGLQHLIALSPIFNLIYRAIGFLSLLGALFILGWIFFKSRRRLHRVAGALGVWFLLNLALYVLYGNVYLLTFSP